MILAAGVGERMRPLTDVTPKPLLKVGGKCLIHRHLEALSACGVRDVVVNVSHLAEQIEESLDDGSQWDLRIQYSREAVPLETAGGICQALELLGDQPFLVVNGDVFTDYPFERLLALELWQDAMAHLIMVPNPPHHPEGDFLVGADGVLQHPGPGETGHTYAGIGIYTPALFDGMQAGVLALRPLLNAAIDNSAVQGEFFSGTWHDIGTPERLTAINKQI